MMGQASSWRAVDDPLFSPFEDPGYRSYFERSFEVVDRFARGELDAESSSAELWRIVAEYDFEMPLPDGFTDHEWALKSRLCRDFLMGAPDLHQRWAERRPDPDLV